MGDLGADLGAVLVRLGTVLGDLGAVLELSWGHLASFWEPSGAQTC